MAQHDHHHEHEHTHAHCGCGHACEPTVNLHATPKAAPGNPTFYIPTMDCAVEEGEIRQILDAMPGIHGLLFRLGERTLTIDAEDDALDNALAAIRKAGFNPRPLMNAEEAPSMHREYWRLGAALALAVLAELIHFFAPHTTPFGAVGIGIAAIAIALAGISTYHKGLMALKQARLNINALMTVAVTGAFLIGQWPEAAMVMALYAIAELIEARSVDRARNAIKTLLDMTPESAEVQQADGSWRDIPATEVPLDAMVRVRPGARIPLDGLVVAGNSAVNQAPITGESIPVDKSADDPVFAGTINETGTLEFRVTATASNTTLARIIHAVEEAQGSRAPTQRFVDRFATVYTPSVFAVALAVALLLPYLTGMMWTESLYKALVLLVIACPCALVIATPVSVVSALAAAARRGILIKGGLYLEEARKLRVIALDKTGTITEGKPRLVATEMLSDRLPESQIRRWAKGLSAHSDHPVSQAIAQALADEPAELNAFTALHGRGVQAEIDGQTITLGNHRLIEDLGVCSAEVEARLYHHEAHGRTVTLLATNEQVLALFAVADTIKPSTREALGSLKRLGITSVMLTGDNDTTAKAIAQEAGIDDARGNLLPEEKLSAIESLQQQYGVAAMTGDGINDAPALARADIGVAMGGAGTDTAIEAADIVIMNDDLRRIPETIQLSRRLNRILWQNIALALGIKLAFLVMAIWGNATMWMAVFADMGASLIVVFNGLRLVRSTTASGSSAPGSVTPSAAPATPDKEHHCSCHHHA